ncbi:hypothetical protein KR018_007800 [Drosophila ironensis]|nr:hypothetical protein KR018_007800 [Drosophila ironensis]
MSGDTRKDPCKPYACRIQACLDANHYQESKCLDVLEAMRHCCLKWHETSLCCSGIPLDKSYLPEAAPPKVPAGKS